MKNLRDSKNHQFTMAGCRCPDCFHVQKNSRTDISNDDELVHKAICENCHNSFEYQYSHSANVPGFFTARINASVVRESAWH